MKKYWYLFVLCFVFLSACIAVPDSIDASIPRVETTVIQARDTELCVVTTGRIEETDKIDIKYEVPLVIDKILVQAGDYAKSGMLLAEVDVEASKKLVISGQGADYGKLEKIPQFITAEKDGTVSVVSCIAGVPVAENTPIFTLVNPSSLQIRVNISEDIISSVATGQKAVITGSGFKNREYSGTVESISPTAKIQQNGTTLQTLVEAVVSIKSADKYLKPGYTTKVKIITNTIKNAIVVPYDAIGQDENNKQFVYIRNGEKARMAYIETMGDCDSGAIIKSGVKNGDNVVINPSALQGDTVNVVVIPEKGAAK